MTQTWLQGLLGGGPRRRPASQPARRCFRPWLELLEDRSVPAGLVVNDMTAGVTAASLVATLLGPGVSASNITYQGNNVSSGTFSGGTGIIGFESGIILSSGQANAVIGPNDGNDTASFDNGLPGNAQLDALVPGNPTFDATVLSFDFVPQGSTLKFNYVFASEEYNKFVGQTFHDVFGFFLNAQNLALVPGTNTPLTIDTVNAGNPANGTPASNPQFYINNAPASDPLPAPVQLNTEMDGLTVVLQVTANVIPGVTNHIDLGVEDVGDGLFDSNVFIQAGSFAAPMAPAFQAYRPFRYAFRSLEQNEGKASPTSPVGTAILPLGGGADVPTLDGNLTLINVGTLAATGPIQVDIGGLPQGVTVVNANGIDSANNEPFITVPVSSVPIGGVVRVPIKISDPLNQPLGTYFVGPLDLSVTFS
jgi:hypothetical protein